MTRRLLKIFNDLHGHNTHSKATAWAEAKLIEPSCCISKREGKGDKGGRPLVLHGAHVEV